MRSCCADAGAAYRAYATGKHTDIQKPHTCRYVIHAIALLMNSNVTPLAEHNEVGGCREATRADCA